jgi:hypothetical protein
MKEFEFEFLFVNKMDDSLKLKIAGFSNTM